MAAAGLLACASPPVAGAQEPTVINTTEDHEPDGCQSVPAGDCTLREALADPLVTEIEVPFDETYYELLLGELLVTRDVTVRGRGDELPTISPGVANPSRVFLIAETAKAQLSGLRIANGDNRGGAGGGIFVDTAASLVLTDSEVSDNVAGSGGGIWSDGTLQVDRSLIAFNDALDE